MKRIIFVLIALIYIGGFYVTREGHVTYLLNGKPEYHWTALWGQDLSDRNILGHKTTADKIYHLYAFGVFIFFSILLLAIYKHRKKIYTFIMEKIVP